MESSVQCSWSQTGATQTRGRSAAASARLVVWCPWWFSFATETRPTAAASSSSIDVSRPSGPVNRSEKSPNAPNRNAP